MTIKTIIWDLEGVILRASEGSVSASIAKAVGMPEEKIRPTLESGLNERLDIGEITQAEYWDLFDEAVHFPEGYRERLPKLFFDHFYIDEAVLKDIHQYHKYLKMCLLTNFSEDIRGMLEDHWHIDNAFDEIVISGEIGMLKPSPEIFMYALKRLNCQPNQAILVDDRASNVAGAQAIGMSAVLYSNRKDMNTQISDLMNNHHSG
jgi:FMN phosphatase YigB (HAD superfamily)